jgi:Domain of unknown function (DUF4329)
LRHCHFFIDLCQTSVYVVIDLETKLMHQIWRLSEASDNNLGLACSEEGLVLGRTPLVERRDGRFVVRERHEIARLLGKGYAAEPRLDRLMHGLGNVATALNAGDQCLARLAAVHLQIPDLPGEAARDAMEAVDILLKSADWNPALHPRLGTSPNPGWFATTEGAATESSTIRTAQNNNSTSDGSDRGSRPGDPFPTAAAAAITALLGVYAISRSTNLEYAGRIYQNTDGTFSYTQGLTTSQRDPSLPNRNCCSDSSTPGDAPLGTLNVGSYHTHPDTPGGSSAGFSGQDVLFYTYMDKRPGYVIGTNKQGIGEIWEFRPGETASEGVSQMLGTISNGSFAPNPNYEPNLKPSTPSPGGDSYDPDRDDKPDNTK